MTNFMRNFQPFSKHLVVIVAMCAILFPHNAFANNDSAQGVKVIVLDAGHGGNFGGAHYGGINEKDINLQVVLKLGALINKNMPNVKVVYTRTTDMMHSKSLGADLQARADIAHRNNGDLFISVHSNAVSNNPNVRGTLTLIMGETSREMSRNESVLYSNNKDELLDMSDHKTATIVRAYIQNLQYTYGMYSEMLGRFIQDEYTKLGLRNHGVRGQPLKVLYATDMPSVLTEIGFMSNPEDLKYITSEEGQEQIAEAIFRAIERYIDIVNRSLLVDGAKPSKPSKGNNIEEVDKKEGDKKEVTNSNDKNTTDKDKADNADKGAEAKETKPATTTTPETTASGQKPANEQQTTKQQNGGEKRYTIQLMAAQNKTPIKNIDFKSLQNGVWILELDATNGIRYKYCYGDFGSINEARGQLDKVHKEFPQAFITSFNRSK